MASNVNTAELRADLHRYIDELDDKFIAVVHSMFDTYVEQQKEDPIIGYNVEGEPIYASVAKREYKARLEAAERGDFTTLDELKEESLKWLKGQDHTE
jgi:hypothetical protein